MTLLVATGLLREARIIARPGVIVVAGGGNAARLEAELEAAVAGAQAVLSSGLAGALEPGLRPGDVVIASSILPGTGRGTARRSRGVEGAHACGEGGPLHHSPSASGPPPRSGEDLLATLQRLFPAAQVGTIIGSDTIVSDKRALHAATGAIAVDMESHVAARVAERHGLPFAVLRTISDGADHGLPPAALVGMRPDGTMALGAVLASLARNPLQLPALIRTGIEAERGFRALARVYDVLGRSGVLGLDLGELPLEMR